MNIIAINGSPRKKWNTATLLQKAIEGAESKGANVELFHLYDLKYQGCISCFGCKIKDSANIGHCTMKDDLSPVLEKILQCDGLLLGSPVYFSNITGEMLSFMERLFFSLLSYNENEPPHFSRTISTASIYTMNIPYKLALETGQITVFDALENRLQRFFNGPSEYLMACDTTQFDNYDKYESSRFDPEHKQQVKEEQFPIDCEKAFEMGVRLTNKLI